MSPPCQYAQVGSIKICKVVDLTWIFSKISHFGIFERYLRRFDCGTFCGNSLEEILQHLWNNSWLKSRYILFQKPISTKTFLKNTYLCLSESPKSIFSSSLGTGYEIIRTLLYPEGIIIAHLHFPATNIHVMTNASMHVERSRKHETSL